jgi:hypothetical protein
MPPKRDAGQKLLEFQGPDGQPLWAEKMEERLAEKFASVAESVHVLDQRLTDLDLKTQNKIKGIEDRLADFEYHQRKYNLIFFGLQEVNPQNAEEKVRKFISRELEIDNTTTTMPFQNCHPLPARGRGQPVIVRFCCFQDKEKIQKNLPKLRGKNIKVTVMSDLPRQLREKRRALWERVKAVRAQNPGKIVRIAERGQEIRVEEKVEGKWTQMNLD